MSQTVNVAIIQARAEYYDLQRCVDKAIHLIAEAARDGAQLVTMGETWFPGYPTWLDYTPDVAQWGHAPTKKVYARLYENSMDVQGVEMQQLQKAARQHGIVLLAGINERVRVGRGNRSIYNSIITIDSTGDIVNHHRKLRPTYTEQMVWAQGDGAGLQAIETAAGRVGSLVCWEHWMPHARQAMHLSNEQIHVAMWPTVHEMHQIASRQYAFEGRCFVLAAGSIFPVSDLPPEFKLDASLQGNPDKLLLNGGSAIIAPDGSYLTEPIYDDETIIHAELDLSQIHEEQMTLDVTGHYARDDVFSFDINRKRLT
ncbi:MAG: carbon-nitrogen hydrolase family protein [Aggregatilineales bacterium]